MNYYTGDLHLGHESILAMQKRPFKNVEEMNRILIDNINARVRNENNDKLYILGDISHHLKPEETINLIKKIKCNKKYLIVGNHDKADAIKELAPELFIDIQPYMEVYDYNHNFVLCHYPFLTWKKQRGGWIHLHGHQHNSAKYNENNRNQGIFRLDVGIEAWNYFPVSSKEILEFFGEKVYMNPIVNYHL